MILMYIFFYKQHYSSYALFCCVYSCNWVVLTTSSNKPLHIQPSYTPAPLKPSITLLLIPFHLKFFVVGSFSSKFEHSFYILDFVLFLVLILCRSWLPSERFGQLCTQWNYKSSLGLASFFPFFFNGFRVVLENSGNLSWLYLPPFVFC